MLLWLGCTLDEPRDSAAPPGGDTDTEIVGCNDENEECAPGACAGSGSTMLPGSDCLACHSAASSYDISTWTAAGTVFADYDGHAPLRGATVRITDADGQIVELSTNSAGNFYTSQPLSFPIQAEVEARDDIVRMARQAESGACNDCHRCQGAASGKLAWP
jgi:hypothetical protein